MTDYLLIFYTKKDKIYSTDIIIDYFLNNCNKIRANCLLLRIQADRSDNRDLEKLRGF